MGTARVVSAAAFAGAEYDFEQPRSAATAATPVAARTDSSKYEMFDYPVGANPPNPAAVQHLTKVRAEQFRSAQS